jgi:hypothetical protein
MREAGFEPAHPEIVGLKSTALDHSAIRAKRSCHILLLLSHSSENNKSYIYIILQLLILKNGKNKRMSHVKNNSSVMPVGLSHLNA